ncbi:MAG: transglutaminase family protein [Leptospiraceae bacterium]|nr:transglutaminase family protein [Leptospiraceae bacterium]
MAEYCVTHTTLYSYSEEVSHCQNIAYLLPQSDDRQECGRTEFTIVPPPAVLAEHVDYFGNRYLYFAIEEPHHRLQVTARTHVKTGNATQPDLAQTPPWDDLVVALRTPTRSADIAAAEFIYSSPFVPLAAEFAEYARPSFAPGRAVAEAAFDFIRRIHRDFRYAQKTTTILTPLVEVFRKRQGVCQDFAHFAIAALRSLGLAARYVSGYIETYPPPGKAKLRGSDASHAWISVYIGDGVWLDFDPTNGKVITEEFIVTARGRDFGDVSPLKGILFGGGKHTLKVEVDVARLTNGKP